MGAVGIHLVHQRLIAIEDTRQNDAAFKNSCKRVGKQAASTVIFLLPELSRNAREEGAGTAAGPVLQFNRSSRSTSTGVPIRLLKILT